MTQPKQSKPAPRLSKKLVIAFGILLVIIIAVAYYLSNKENELPAQNDSALNINKSELTDGAFLAKQYCQSCHLLPDPLSLNKNKWKKILPQMGLRLGIKNHYGESYEESIKSSELKIPAHPLLSDEQWQRIFDYYVGQAPVFLPAQQRSVPIKRTMPFFSVTEPAASFLGKQVLATYVKIDTSVRPRRIFVADGQAKKLFMLNSKLKVIDSISTAGPVVDISISNKQLLVCMIGTELGANDDKAGTILELHVSSNGKLTLDTAPLFKNLARPVQVLTADLNNDQRMDNLICEFGNLSGELSWMENKGGGTFSKHSISKLPGAIKAYVEYNKTSKLPDIWILFTQGQERIDHLINKGAGVFAENTVLRFPAIYGSSFFERVDINHDGFKDIVYTCGDNGNATLILKPYHGVYIFMNDGHEQYHQQFFYPINGCYKALARDFDNDGNIDIATISLYTDARQPEEGFVYFKNMGGLNFQPHSLPAATHFERAVTLDEGDIAGDGKKDLIIGNAFFDIGPFSYNIHEPLFYVLKNKAANASPR